MNTKKRIALIGGGPSALYLCKHILIKGFDDTEITIFEKTTVIGSGMPYSRSGANDEHITNVSDTEIPDLLQSVHDWSYTAPAELLERFNITPERFNEYKVLPRLFFGEYLSAQFRLLIDCAEKKGIKIHLHLNEEVQDIQDDPDKKQVLIETNKNKHYSFDTCIMCIGHSWPKKHEDKIPGYYDSPYPPSKLLFKANHPVAIRGSSLTAIDVLRTLSRMHGSFTDASEGIPYYTLSADNPAFRMVLYSSNGLLPAIRIHSEESQIAPHELLSTEAITENRNQNNGFLSLDFVFDTAFKKPLKEKDPEFYMRVQHMNMESFVDVILKSRERQDAFLLFQKEYQEADASIQLQEPIYWKELLTALSFTINYPAKYFSAEDMERLHKTLGELISIIIAFVPQSSAKEILALHKAGVLEIIDVDKKSYVEPLSDGGIVYHYVDEQKKPTAAFYRVFIDAIGQASVPIEGFPFKTLLKEKTISQARVKFKDQEKGEREFRNGNKDVYKHSDGSYSLNVSGIAINDSFQILNEEFDANERLYIMAVPYISGYNPDYSGLDFCNKASELICNQLFQSYNK